MGFSPTFHVRWEKRSQVSDFLLILFLSKSCCSIIQIEFLFGIKNKKKRKKRNWGEFWDWKNQVGSHGKAQINKKQAPVEKYCCCVKYCLLPAKDNSVKVDDPRECGVQGLQECCGLRSLSSVCKIRWQGQTTYGSLANPCEQCYFSRTC